MFFTRAWRNLRYLLKCMASVLGDPSRVAADLTIPAARRLDILAFLRPLERMARILLFAEAARLPAHKAAAAPRKSKPKAKCERREIPEDSAAWRVSFSALPTAYKQTNRAARRARPWFMADLPSDPVPLAARFEALIRVVLDPTSYAKRLARRLDRRGLSRRTARRLMRPVPDDAPPMHRSLKRILPLAERARARFRDTS